MIGIPLSLVLLAAVIFKLWRSFSQRGYQKVIAIDNGSVGLSMDGNAIIKRNRIRPLFYQVSKPLPLAVSRVKRFYRWSK
jgi:hypothetical protein